LLFVLAAPGGAQTAQTVEVNPARVYTPTGIAVKAGDEVQITATGRIAFGGGPIANLGPDGIPWGRRCTDIAASEGRGFPWPARGLSCWSLFARVGPSDPVEIGSGATFTAERGGQLRLGLNDNYAADNTGTFTAEVTLNPPAVPTTTGTPGGPTGPGTATDDEGGSGAVCSSSSARPSSLRSACSSSCTGDAGRTTSPQPRRSPPRRPCRSPPPRCSDPSPFRPRPGS
jgi:hypothetical protein